MEEKNLTLVLLKPTAVKRRLCGRIIRRFEDVGLTLLRLELKKYPRSAMEELYREHRGKDFYEDIVEWMSSQAIIALVLSGGEGIVNKVRLMIGATDPAEAEGGTIRGDYAASIVPDNIIHASDSQASAEREIKIFFPDLEM